MIGFLSQGGGVPTVGGNWKAYTLPQTNIAPENGWLEEDCILFGWLPGRCELLVSGRGFLQNL